MECNAKERLARHCYATALCREESPSRAQEVEFSHAKYWEWTATTMLPFMTENRKRHLIRHWNASSILPLRAQTPISWSWGNDIACDDVACRHWPANYCIRKRGSFFWRVGQACLEARAPRKSTDTFLGNGCRLWASGFGNMSRLSMPLWYQASNRTILLFPFIRVHGIIC
jgi:hypothetical protein